MYSKFYSLLYIDFPFLIVSKTSISFIFIPSTFNGFLSKITKSASLPAVKLPFLSVSSYCEATLIVIARTPSYGVTLWSAPTVSPPLEIMFTADHKTII
ncbi:hypothetical protein Flavo103_44130 [Flavobacterium collinsii]|nr:hypothetical protein Flavo103_44130 [Flavobacterium collinsii]